MKKFIAALALFVGLSANANVINIAVSDSNVALGETVSVSLIASGFEDFDSFDFDFDFDTSVFSYDSSSLISDLSFGLAFEVNQVADGMALSFFDFSPVNGDFLLASFDLIALSSGFSSFSIGDLLFSDTIFQTDLVVTADNTLEVEVSDVPAPATLGLLTLALFGLVGLRRKA